MTVIGCKDEKSEETKTEAPKEEVISNAFNVKLDVVIKQDAQILLFYTTDGGTDFSKITPLGYDLKGSPSPQQINFTLPEGVQPTEFRIDFGKNPKQEDIYFNKITFKYLGKERAIACPEMLDYFRADDNNCTFNTTTGLIQTKEGKSPSVYPNEKNLLAALQKLW